MATREKKLSLGRKQNTSSPLPSKEEVTPGDVKTSNNDMASEEMPTFVKNPAARGNARGTSLAKKLANKSPTKKLNKQKSAFSMKLKPQNKKNVKIKKTMIKAMLSSPKNADTKKKLLKNCVKQIKPKKGKVVKGVKPEENLPPPVLEPIFPIDDNVDNKQVKRNTQKGRKPPKIDSYAKKIKVDSNDSPSIAFTVDENLTLDQSKAKTTYKKKSKAEMTVTESIEDVMNDLSSLIKDGDVKEEGEVLSESSKGDSVKPKKVAKKNRRENIENTLSKLSPSQRKVIDMLDLNVQKFKNLPVNKRRHSIEKFPIGTLDSDVSNISQLSVFNSLPRCISPRSKILPKLRQTVDGFSRRSNPYKTRSDSPARVLRNGKHRKLKDTELLDGLDSTYKRRKRNCSEFSGSEISTSKHSEYESDSSFSDMSSLHGAENVESKDVDAIKSECKENYEMGDELSADNINRKPLTAVVKRSISIEHETNVCIADTNSNFYNGKDNGADKSVKTEVDVCQNIATSPSLKVPEKSLILDIMKQTFNDSLEDKALRERRNKSAVSLNEQPEPVSSAIFYGNGCATSCIDDNHLSPKPLDETENKDEVQKEDDVQVILDSSEEALQEDNTVLQETIQDVASTSNVEESKPEEQVEEPAETTENQSDVIVCDNKDSDGPRDDVPENEVVVNEPEPEPVLPENGVIAQEADAAIEETPENPPTKEDVLQALGLQSLEAAKEAKQRIKEKADVKTDNYTGTLKTVIKINRDKKRGKNSMKVSLHKNKSKNIDYENQALDDGLKAKDGATTSWKSTGQSSDTAGAHRKSHYSNRSNMDGSSEHTSDGETGSQEGAAKALVIPEKASSFSIHPGRLCKDVCSYCFGKFGLFDTPCHIAQMKSVERQDKILSAEKHLTRDSCLCDACYRHVDRKANTPSYSNKSYKRGAIVAPVPRQDHCHVLGCGKAASNILRRKWIIKMRKSVCDVINIDLNNPGLHSIPVCDEHYSMLEHLMVCAMCKRRLASKYINYLGPETADLNLALNAEGIPLTLSEKPIVCKLCNNFAAIILKSPEERPENSTTFFVEYKKRLLHFNDIVPMDEAAAEEPIIIPTKEKSWEREQVKKKKKLTKNLAPGGDIGSDSQVDVEKSDQSRVPSSDSTNHSRPESPSDYMVDYNTLIPSIAMECGSDSDSRRETIVKPTTLKKIPRPETIKQAVEISKIIKLKNDKNSDIAVQRLGSNPSISVRQLFPCEEDLPLQGQVDFGNVKERTPEGWEKCSSVVQYDMETKQLWQELQKPYGNQSSFLRHLILLEKYFRNGDLILAPNASHHSVNYSESVHNRLRAYDNIASTANNVQPLSMLPFNRPQKSHSGIITSTNLNSKESPPATTVVPILNAASLPKSTPITISQLNSPPLIPPILHPKPKPVGAPPGLISLLPGTNRPVAPLIRPPQSQKIKFPITKNWRPNLIPIDPSKKAPERRAGLVQVISNGKPYHITLEDYKKMCAIKKSFELRQKRFQEATSPRPVKLACNSVLKSIGPRKGLIISKTSTTTATTTTTSTGVDMHESELEKLDRQVEKLESKLSESKTALSLPKIPKSLTVIPQTVTRKPSRPSSPILMITQKPKQILNKS